MKGGAEKSLVHYKSQEGNGEDFLIFIEDVEAYKTYKKGLTDKSVSKPGLVDVVQAYKIFTTHGHGTSGLFEEASNLEKETHFGTKNDEAIIDKILEHGNLQENKFPERSATTNDSQGPHKGANLGH